MKSQSYRNYPGDMRKNDCSHGRGVGISGERPHNRWRNRITMKQSTLMSRFVNRLLIATIFLSAPVLLAGPEIYEDSKSIPPPEIQPWCETPAPLEIRIGIPGWISRLEGDFGVKGLAAPLDIGFDTLLKHLDEVPVVLSGYVRYHRWELFGDGEYIQLHDSVTLPGLLFTNADLGIKYGFVEGFIGYRLINCQKGSLSLYTGVRYNYYSGDFQISNNNDPRFPILRRLFGIPNSREVSGSTDWVDPVVGLGGRVKIWKPITLYANGDVGGFDANSSSAFELTRRGRVPISSEDWSYQVQGGVEFQVTHWMWAQVGWRYLKYDFVRGGFTNKTELNGPFIQGGVNF
jgi:opacity protein-like surface antigen